MYIIGCLFVAIFGFVYFAMLDSQVTALIFVAVALSGLPIMTMYGPEAALIAESFSPRLRYSGCSLGYQLASIIAGGPSPFIATALLAPYHSSLPIASGPASARMRAKAVWPRASARKDSPMPHRIANFAKVATVAGPAMPIRTGQTMSVARNAAIQRRIGTASKPNWVTSDTSRPCRRAKATFARSALSRVRAAILG